MGNQDSALSLPAPQPIQNLELSHLGPVTLMRSHESYCLLKIFSFNDHFLMEQRLRKFKNRVSKLSRNPHVLDLYSLSKVEKKQLCANNYQIHVFMEQPQCTLRDLISRRLRDKKNFSQEELFTFLAKVVNSLIYIQDNGLKNIQIDSEAIVQCGENVKVMDCGVAASKTYYQLLERREKGLSCPANNIYLAPQLLKELQELNYDPYISPKADIFSIGMILLQMVTLEPMQGYYDYSHASIDYDSLIHRLSRINHSLPLKTLIAEMLEFDPQERIGLVSLKEKIQKLKNPQMDQAQIARSKSSKMLKEILSQSRRSGSLSRGDSAALSRQPSTERKHNSKIEVHCSGKKLDMTPIDSKETKETEEQAKDKKEVKKQAVNSHYDNGIDQVQFKNLVKNRLIKDRQRNKQNSQASTQTNHITKLASQSRTKLQQTRTLLDRNHNHIDPLSSYKFQSSNNSKVFQSSSGFNKASLSKLVQDSGLKNLLKIEQLNESGFKKSQPQSMKNTSRFGYVQNSELKEKYSSKGLRKISQIYIRQEDASEGQAPLITVRDPISHQRQLQKVMTFNNKEFLISARSVERSLNEISPPNRHQEEKLTFSPIATQQRHNQSCDDESPQAKMTIKDVPVVISQQKQYEPAPISHNFGRLQRNLHLLDCAQSIQQDSVSNDHFDSSKVLESFKPQSYDEEYRSVNIHTSKVESYNRDNSCFLKKNKKKPELNIQLHQDEQSNYAPSFQERRNHQQHQQSANQTPYQRISNNKSKLAGYKTSQSNEQLSNFTSISPPQDSKDSISTLKVLFQPTNFSNKSEESHLKKRLVLNNGDVYEGQLSLSGLPQGQGTLYNPSGVVKYFGSFKSGKFDGYGNLFNLSHYPSQVDHQHLQLSRGYWTHFNGQFQQGTKTGFGTIYFPQNQKFCGCLKRDTIEGYGCFYKKTGELISGLWRDNKFQKI